MTRREWRALSPVLLLVMVLSLVIGMIVHADAFRERVQDLNSSGVWVTSDARLVFARMNRVAGSLDTLISDPSQQQAYHLDVLQDGDSVLGLQRDLGRLFPIDARDSQVVEGVELVVEPASRVAMGGGVLALVTPSGEVRVTAYGKGQIPDPRLLMTERALVTQLEAGMVPGFDITVDANGWVLAASTSGQWALITPGADPIVDSVLPLSSVQVTLVAGTGVIADPALAVVQTTSGQYFQLGSAIALQQASTSGDQVVVATTTGLVALPLGDDSDLVKDLYALPDRVERMPAAPVVMGGYIYGAWSGPAVNQVWIGPDGEAHEQLTDQADRALIDPVFRVNFGSIYLNDLRTGWVFDLIEQLAIEELEEEPQETSPEPQDGPRPNDPVKAIDDHLWVRPGTTSILHVLDNDLNPGGGLLAIRSVGVPNVGTVEISPNGQTIIYRAPQNASGDVVFAYTVSSRSLIDEEDLSSTAAVTVSMRPVNENSAPYIREGLPERRYSVISSGTIAISPLADWRDDDSDPLVIVEAVGAQGRIIPVTNQSVIRYSASPTEVSIDEVITYTVADSNGELTSGELVVQILRALAQEGIPPVANSDVVRGVIGQPLTISPLDNDQPGAAPLLGSAKLRLASPVDGLIGLSVETDLASGVVTVVGTRVGVYLLTYTAAYGALTDTAFIRVDIAEQGSLVAMPDAMVLRGMVGGYVDVLVNDHDPSGSVLTVVSAQAREPNLFGIAVVQGRWLWVQAKAETATSDVSVVDYVVTDGRGNEAIGQVCVTLRPAVADDTVRTVDDHAVVRAGDVTLVAVLDNDVAASGRPLVLNDNAPGLPPGELKVQDLAAPNESTADQVGRAFVDGVNVRYVAPAVVTAVLLVRVEYQASVPGGTPVTGSLWVEVRPAPDPPGGQLVNRAPTPVSLEVRCVLGSTVEIAVSPYGQDPDGDSVAVTGIAQPPKYGRVVEIIGNTLIYESYPDITATGTDTFQFYVKDRYGGVGIGGVRIGVVRPGQVPEPVAIADFVIAAPGTSLYIRPTINDLLPIGTRSVVVQLDGSPPGVTLVTDPNDPERVTNIVQLITPPADATQALSFGYHLSSGGRHGPSAQVTVRSQKDYRNPPRVYDHVAPQVAAGSVRVPVLNDAWDLDGPKGELKIVWVSVGRVECERQSSGLEDCQVVIPVTAQAQTVAYVVEDGTGARASAAIFVPGASLNRPNLLEGSLITLEVNGTKTIELNDYVVSERGQSVHLTAAQRAWTAPSAHLALGLVSDTTVTLTAMNDYIGPAALTVEVRDSDGQDPDRIQGLVTIPIQIGPVSPVLFCPTTAIEVVQGGAARDLPIADLCHVWMPNPDLVKDLRFTGQWVAGSENFLPPTNGAAVRVQATSNARTGATGRLLIGVEGYSTTGELSVRVGEAGKPTVTVPSLTDVAPGSQVRVGVALVSPLQDPTPTIVQALDPTGASVVVVQGMDLLITLSPEQRGVVVINVVASDVTDELRHDRQVRTSFTITLARPPDPPSPPQAAGLVRAGSLYVSYLPGADNGSPILGYTVEWEGGSQSCGVNTTCEITGLTEGLSYRFRAKAHNKIGESDWSDWGPMITLSALPGRIQNLSCREPWKTQEVTLTWEAPATGAPPTGYVINGNDTIYQAPASARSITIPLVQGILVFTGTVFAENESGRGEVSPEVSCWAPEPPSWASGGAVWVSAQKMGDIASLLIQWLPAYSGGPGSNTYTVYRSVPGSSAAEVVVGTTESLIMTDTVALDGLRYVYWVEARNIFGMTGRLMADEWWASDSPAEWSTLAKPVTMTATGASGEVKVRVDQFPDWRGTAGTVYLTYKGADKGTISPGVNDQTLYVSDQGVNGLPFTVYLQACNQSGCNTATPFTMSDGAFGPLQLFGQIEVESMDGEQMCFKINAAGNGRPAELTYTAKTIQGAVIEVSPKQIPIPETGMTAAVTCAKPPRGVGFEVTVNLNSAPTVPARAGQGTVKSFSWPEPQKLPEPVITLWRDIYRNEGRGVCAEVRMSVPTPVSLRVYAIDPGQVKFQISAHTVRYPNQINWSFCWDAKAYRAEWTVTAQIFPWEGEDWLDSDVPSKKVTSLIAPPAPWQAGAVRFAATGTGPFLMFEVLKEPANTTTIHFTYDDTEQIEMPRNLAPYQLDAAFVLEHKATGVIACTPDPIDGTQVCNKAYELDFGPLIARSFGQLAVSVETTETRGKLMCVIFLLDSGGMSPQQIQYSHPNGVKTSWYQPEADRVEACADFTNAQPGDQVTIGLELTDRSDNQLGRTPVKAEQTLVWMP